MNYTTYTVRIWENGTKYWYNEINQLHNEHGPAVELIDGTKCYCLNDKLHKTDGPAIERADGSKEYWLNSMEYSYGAWKEEVEKSKVKELTLSEVSKLLGFDVKIVKSR